MDTAQEPAISSCKEWLSAGGADPARATVAVAGVPIGRASISENHGWSTPPVFRRELSRYPTWDAERRRNLADHLCLLDLGDIEGDEHDPDATAAHRRIQEFTAARRDLDAVLVLIGGDNSLTRPALLGLAGDSLATDWGLLTLDAHHDTRPVEAGVSRNGTPVRELIEAGLPGRRVAQVGLQRFGNNADTVHFAVNSGIHCHHRSQVTERGIEAVVRQALAEIIDAGAHRIYVDFDIDVHDQSVAPGCPASMPGGLTADEGRRAAFEIGSHPQVVALDMTEVDASRPGGAATARLMGDLFLHFCAGVADRFEE